MKRIYVCIGIVVLLLAAAFYSSFRVQQFAEDISEDIDTAMENIRNSDLTGARPGTGRRSRALRHHAGGHEPPAPHAGLTELEAACAPPMATWN